MLVRFAHWPNSFSSCSPHFRYAASHLDSNIIDLGHRRRHLTLKKGCFMVLQRPFFWCNKTISLSQPLHVEALAESWEQVGRAKAPSLEMVKQIEQVWQMLYLMQGRINSYFSAHHLKASWSCERSSFRHLFFEPVIFSICSLHLLLFVAILPGPSSLGKDFRASKLRDFVLGWKHLAEGSKCSSIVPKAHEEDIMREEKTTSSEPWSSPNCIVICEDSAKRDPKMVSTCRNMHWAHHRAF